ncbi:MAG: hypothetical protein ACE5IR_25385 [bacterium]
MGQPVNTGQANKAVILAFYRIGLPALVLLDSCSLVVMREMLVGKFNDNGQNEKNT